ncbi:MAG: tRNA pseudouridine(38-40) synthase TruA [Candidatus Gastranaerophilaceae bacterium]|jgi:tRNA pseudouridine38-40 synthase
MLNSKVQNIISNNVSEDFNIFRYAVVLEYIGTEYAGSQMQPAQKTIQSELENALKIICRQNVKTTFSGRTDSGVHSKGQVVHFDISQKIDEFRFITSLNAILPSDISVNTVTEVDKTFNSCKNAKYRWYRYKILNKQARSVWNKESAHIWGDFDIDTMNMTLKYLEGCHDFSAFKSASSKNPVTECIVYSANCSASGDYINIDLVANRFIHNMVRIIAGTVIKIGKGEKTPQFMKEVLISKDRTLAGPTAPAEGLTLMCVGYSKKYNLFECINKEANKDENIFRQAS